MPALIDLSGQRFERLVVLEKAPKSDWVTHEAHWTVQCDCGATKVVAGGRLRRGETKSCGCLRREHLAAHNQELEEVGNASAVIHGYHDTPTYQTWKAMKTRCYNPNQRGYKWYGALGVEVCERWRNSFANFLEDMGERPEGMTLDRLDPTGNYEPDNCQWADWETQVHSRRPKGSVYAS